MGFFSPTKGREHVIVTYYTNLVVKLLVLSGINLKYLARKRFKRSFLFPDLDMCRISIKSMGMFPLGLG